MAATGESQHPPPVCPWDTMVDRSVAKQIEKPRGKRVERALRYMTSARQRAGRDLVGRPERLPAVVQRNPRAHTPFAQRYLRVEGGGGTKNPHPNELRNNTRRPALRPSLHESDVGLEGKRDLARSVHAHGPVPE